MEILIFLFYDIFIIKIGTRFLGTHFDLKNIINNNFVVEKNLFYQKGPKLFEF